MDWIITYSLIAVTIITFYSIVYKLKENFKLASLAVLYYVLCYTVIGMLALNFKDTISLLLDYSFSSPVFSIMFIFVKVIFWLSIPVPVIFAYCRVKKIMVHYSEIIPEYSEKESEENEP